MNSAPGAGRKTLHWARDLQVIFFQKTLVPEGGTATSETHLML